MDGRGWAWIRPARTKRRPLTYNILAMSIFPMTANHPDPGDGAAPGRPAQERDGGRRPRGAWGWLQLSDEAAMQRVQGGDDRAFSLLVRRWEGPIMRLCTRMTGDVHLGQDMAQETFGRLFAARASYEPARRFSTFLWRIAVNACLDDRRRRARRPEAPLEAGEAGLRRDAEVAADAPSPPAAAAQQEESEMVRAAVAGLPEHYRAVVLLRHYEGLKFREVAEVLGIPEGTVKSRMAEALGRLATALGPVRGEPTRGQR